MKTIPSMPSHLKHFAITFSKVWRIRVSGLSNKIQVILTIAIQESQLTEPLTKLYIERSANIIKTLKIRSETWSIKYIQHTCNVQFQNYPGIKQDSVKYINRQENQHSLWHYFLKKKTAHSYKKNFGILLR